MLRDLKPEDRAERDAIVAEIHAAFAGVTRGAHGISWNECVAIDNHESQESRVAARRSDTDAHWSELVDSAEWEPFPGVGGFSFINAEGFRYYLPPTMVRLLRGENTEWYTGHLLGVIEKFAEQHAAWSEPERRCIARFIDFMARHDEDMPPEPDEENPWLDALHKRWAAYLPCRPDPVVAPGRERMISHAHTDAQPTLFMPSAVPCPACDRISRIRRGEDPELLAELDESYAVLGDCQHWPGWCTLFLKDHHDHLADLPIERQSRLFTDVARVAQAICAAVSPRRLNYECLGNVLAHVHWHIVPRHEGDAQPRDTVWVRPAEERADRGDPAARAGLVVRLRAALTLPARV